MTLYSKQSLRDRILHDMGVLDIAESASAVDSELLDPIVQQSLEELEDENLVIFNSQLGENIENIPGRLFGALADFIRFNSCPAYVLPQDMNVRNMALTRLRRSIMAGSDDTPVRANFF